MTFQEYQRHEHRRNPTTIGPPNFSDRGTITFSCSCEQSRLRQRRDIAAVKTRRARFVNCLLLAIHRMGE
jgi:hypothetical protein